MIGELLYPSIQVYPAADVHPQITIGTNWKKVIAQMMTMMVMHIIMTLKMCLVLKRGFRFF